MKKRESNENKLNAKLFVRILPTTDFSYNSIHIDSNKKVLYVRCLQDSDKRIKPKNPNYWYFCTDGVFWNSSQSDVYDTVTFGLFEEVFKGSGALILCYGQTGAGKTFTASGLRFHYQNRGLILRILSQLFDEEEQRRDVTKISFGISYVEFVGGTIKDLITNKTLRNLNEIMEYPMSDETWAWKQIFDAEARKSYSEEAPYKGSNRGHSVLTFYTHAESLIDTDPVITHSKIHIVDMSGIDILGNKPSYWKNKTDLGNANLSKTFMEQFLLCLTGCTKCLPSGHNCPPKSGRFLFYLQDTINPQCLVRFIAHIYGNDSNIRLTLSTLRFGELIQSFSISKLERTYENGPLLMKTLEKEYLRLKEEKELMGMLINSPDFSEVSQQRLEEIRRAAKGFLAGQLEGLTLLSLGQTTLTMETFRNLYQKVLSDKDAAVKEAIANTVEKMQTQAAAERNLMSYSKLSTSSSQKVSKVKSKVQDSQSIGSSFRSSESGQTAIRNLSTPQQVGTTDRKGIGIGPGKTASSFEGNITKAFKKLKSRKADNFVVKNATSTSTKESVVGTEKAQPLEDSSEITLTIPSRDEAWQHFSEGKSEAFNDMRNNVKVNQELCLAAKRKYTETLAELAKLRNQLEEGRSELRNLQHIRLICGKERFDEEGNLILEESEQNMMDFLFQKEQEINVAVENCHVALINFSHAVEELNEVKKILEEAFQEFCKVEYKTFVGPKTFITEEAFLEEASKETLMNANLGSQAQMALYSYLQEKLLNHVPKTSKREWNKIF